MENNNTTNERLVLTPHAVKRHGRRLQHEIKQIIEQKDLNKFNLSQSQDMFARILGMKDWHEMNKVLFHETSNNDNIQFNHQINNEVEDFINNYDVKNINYIRFIEDICRFEDIKTITFQTNDNIVIQYNRKNITLKIDKNNHVQMDNAIETLYGASAINKLNGGTDLDIPWSVRMSREKTIRFRINITAVMCVGQKGYSITLWKLKEKAKDLHEITTNKILIESMNAKKGLVIIGGNAGSEKDELIYSFLQNQLNNELKNASIKVGFYQYLANYIEQNENNDSSISYVQIGQNIVDIKSAILNSSRRNLDIAVFEQLNSSEDIRALASVVSHNNNIAYTTIASGNLESLVYKLFSGLEKNTESYSELIEQLSTVIQQDVVKDIHNNPLYLQSYLEFNEDVKDMIIDMINGVDFTFDYFRAGIKSIIKEHMVTSERGLLEALKNKRIDKDLYQHYKKIFRI